MLVDGRWTGRYDSVAGGVNRTGREEDATWPSSAADRRPLGRTGLAVTPPRLRRRVDRRPLPAGRRRRRDRGRPPRLGPRDPAVRHGAAVRLRRGRAAGRARPGRTGRATSTSSRRRSAGSCSTPASVPPGADVDPQMLDGRVDAAYADVGRPLDRLRLLRRRHPPVARGEPGAARPRPDRHRPDPRPGRPLGGRDRRGVPGARPAPRGGRDPGDRRRDEPVGDARPVRPRGRLRRVPARRPLHAPRPGRARRAAAAVRRSAASRS